MESIRSHLSVHRPSLTSHGPSLSRFPASLRFRSIKVPKKLVRLNPHSSLRDGQELVQLRVIRSVRSADAGCLLAQEDYKLLDVRPIWEKEKSFVAGSYHVPLFVEDEDTSYITLLKKSIQMGYGGVWMGQRLTTENEKFLEQVRSVFPENSQKVLVVCGEGLRSLMAVGELHEAGYTNLAWLDGGFSKARDGHFPDVEGSTKLQFANIGGAAEYLLKFLLFTRNLVNSLIATKAAPDNPR